MTIPTTSQAATLSLNLFGLPADEAGDRLPSFVSLGVRRVKQVKYNPEVRRERKRKPAVMPTLGHIVPSPEKPAPAPPEIDDIEEELDLVEIELPEEEIPDGPGYDGINYGKRQYDVVGENEIEVPDELLADIRDTTAVRSEAFREALFETASLLYAHADAANFVEAAMSDGLGMHLEMDEALEEAFVPFARLQALSKLVELSTLTEQAKKILHSRLAVKLGDEMVSSLHKKRPSEALAALSKQYAATVTRSGVAPDMEPQQTPTVGVRVSRG